MTKFVEDTYANIAQVYSDKFFDDVTDLPLVNLLAEALSFGSKVLDLGCGPGQFSKYLSEKGFRVEGVDNSGEMLTIANKKVPGIAFRKMDMRHLDYADETFDAILAAYSIIHIPTEELETVCREIRRVLKHSGYALFITQQGKPDQVLDEPLAPGEKIFMNFFTKERIETLLAANGFELVAQKSIHQNGSEVLSNTVIGTLAART